MLHSRDDRQEPCVSTQSATWHQKLACLSLQVTAVSMRWCIVRLISLHATVLFAWSHVCICRVANWKLSPGTHVLVLVDTCSGFSGHMFRFLWTQVLVAHDHWALQWKMVAQGNREKGTYSARIMPSAYCFGPCQKRHLTISNNGGDSLYFHMVS